MRLLQYVMILLMIGLCLLAQETDDPLLFHETFENGADNWQPLFSQNWRIIQQEDSAVYELMAVGEAAEIRKPKSMSILTPYSVGNFDLEVQAQCYTDPSNTRRDICLFFGYQDDVHFYYVHFSGTSDAVHNAIHIVNNADREKINIEAPGESKALLTEKKWYTLRVIRDVETGTIHAFVDGVQVLSAVDTTFKSGKIGLGSFDDTGAFRNVKLWGQEIDTSVGHALPPQHYELAQNNPNPFNPTTRIHYHLGAAENVKVDIFDLCGRHQCSVVDQHQNAGAHSIAVNAQTLPSGIYVYRLFTSSFSDAKKMTVLK